MASALYRKYRSKKFEQVIGQEHITTTIVNSLKNKTFSHAYLLTGPRGVGKTSIARLFAFAVNGIDYDESKTYSDIIEIDAASNRRIDEIRELREKIGIVPSILKYKVYIIDEVHMLTKEAFNALLKTLEEPPEHAIFILATTDLQKVPDTIKSRCVRFSFLSIPDDKIKKHLQQIAKQESIKIEDGALQLIAENSDGSFRDAISFLDQFRNSGETITESYVSQVLGMGSTQLIEALISALEDSSPQSILDALAKLRDSGADDNQIVKQLSAHLRAYLLDSKKNKLGDSEVVQLIESLLEISRYSDVRLAFEVALLKAVANNDAKPAGTKTPNSPKKSEPIAELAAPPDEAVIEEEVLAKITEVSVKPNEGENDLWQSVLLELKSSNSTLHGIARMADVEHKDSLLVLSFEFPFHSKQMNLEKNRLVIERMVRSKDKKINQVDIRVSGGPKKPGKKNGEDKISNKEPVSSISNIFGSAEVLES